MKYSDEQRIAKIQETTEKLLNYISRDHITPEQIFHVAGIGCRRLFWLRIFSFSLGKTARQHHTKYASNPQKYKSRSFSSL